MIVWYDEIINNDMRCTGCGTNFLTENKWPVNIIVYTTKRKGVCKHCGKEVCKLKKIKP